MTVIATEVHNIEERQAMQSAKTQADWELQRGDVYASSDGLVLIGVEEHIYIYIIYMYIIICMFVLKVYIIIFIYIYTCIYVFIFLQK